MKGYIYIITNLINNKQYIGQTTTTIPIRYNAHIRDAKYNNTNMIVHKAMRKYGIDNFDVKEIQCIDADLECDLREQLNELEIYYIQKYNTLTPNGYNMTKGGNQFREYDKIKVDEYDLYGNYIQTHDSIINAARSVNSNYSCAIEKCCKGISKFAFKKIWRFNGDRLDKYELPDIEIASRDYKIVAVDQYDLDGNYITSYNSIADAIKSLNKEVSLNASHISECCNGKIRSVYGFIWRYKGDPLGDYKDNRTVSISKYDKNGVFIESYDTFKDACLSVGKYNDTVSGNIRRCCKGERKTAYNYIWKYNN